MRPKVSISKKIAIIVLGVFFSLIVLEVVLRLGGLIFVSFQEYKNRQANYVFGGVYDCRGDNGKFLSCGIRKNFK
jgi:hypothetical protein